MPPIQQDRGMRRGCSWPLTRCADRSSGRASAGIARVAVVRHGGRLGDAGEGVATNVPVQWPASPRQSSSVLPSALESCGALKLLSALAGGAVRGAFGGFLTGSLVRVGERLAGPRVHHDLVDPGSARDANIERVHQAALLDL